MSRPALQPSGRAGRQRGSLSSQSAYGACPLFSCMNDIHPPNAYLSPCVTACSCDNALAARSPPLIPHPNLLPFHVAMPSPAATHRLDPLLTLPAPQLMLPQHLPSRSVPSIATSSPTISCCCPTLVASHRLLCRPPGPAFSACKRLQKRCAYVLHKRCAEETEVWGCACSTEIELNETLQVEFKYWPSTVELRRILHPAAMMPAGAWPRASSAACSLQLLAVWCNRNDVTPDLQQRALSSRGLAAVGMQLCLRVPSGCLTARRATHCCEGRPRSLPSVGNQI